MTTNPNGIAGKYGETWFNDTEADHIHHCTHPEPHGHSWHECGHTYPNGLYCGVQW